MNSMLSLSCGLLVAALLLSGCEATWFEKPPIAEAACDQRLVGRWDSIGGNEESDGEVQVDIAGDCTIRVSDLHKGRMRTGESTRVHVGSHGGHDYLWLDSAWSLARFDSDLAVAAGDVLVLRYSVQGDELSLLGNDDKAIAHRILDGDVPGSTVKDDERLQNRITGGPHPKLLENDWFFDREASRFRRAARARSP